MPKRKGTRVGVGRILKEIYKMKYPDIDRLMSKFDGELKVCLAAGQSNEQAASHLWQCQMQDVKKSSKSP